MSYWNRVFCAVALGAIFIASPAIAQVFVVPGGAGSQNGSNWANAYASIQAAVNDPNAASQDVWVAQGTYNQNSIVMPADVSLYGGFTIGDSSFGQRDFANNVTTINAGGNGRVITIEDVLNVRVDGFTLTNGNAATEPQNGGGWGGAMWVSSTDENTVIANCRLTNSTASAHGGGANIQSANPIFQNCVFQNNNTGNFGGGAFNHFGQAAFVGCSFIDNTAANGGGLANWTTAQNHVVTDCTFTNNITPATGGGLVSGNGAITTVTNSTFTLNGAVNGGAAYAGFTGGAINFSGSTFQTNSSSNLGGALFLDSGGSVSVTDSLFEGNTSAVHGGAIAAWPGQVSWSVERSIFRQNIANDGGGAIFHHGPADGGGAANLSVTNSVFDRNTATNWVSGAIATWNLANTTIVNSSFAGNTAAAGGGAFFTGDGVNAASKTVTNSIIAFNSMNQVDINGGSTTTFANSILFGQSFAGAADVNPLFVNQPAGDLRITSGSPARNAGLSPAPATDILGTPRPQGPAADMGAYEFDDVPPGISLGAPSVSTTNTGPVTYTVTYSDFSAITLSAGDVSLVTTGTATGDIAVSGTDPTRTVTISNITGDGTIGINIAAGTAQDFAGNVAPGASGTPFTVDNTGPGISVGAPSAGSTNTGPVSYTVTYTDADSVSLTVGDVSLVTTGSATGDVAVTGTGNTTRTVTISNTTGDGTIAIEIAAGTAEDALGNEALAAGPSSVFTVDNTPPDISVGAPSPGVTNTGPVEYIVTYTGADTILLSDMDISLVTTGTADGQAFVGPDGPNSRRVEVINITGDGTIAINIAAGTASDIAGNLAGTASGASFDVTNTGPSITVGAPSASITNTGPVSYTVNYTGAASVTLDETDITLNTTGDATGDVAVTGSGTTTRTVTISNITGDGTIAISIAAGTAEDAFSNLSGPASGAAFTVDNTPPGISIGAPSVSETASGPVSFVVSYTGASSVSLNAGDVTLVATGTATGNVGVSGSGTGARTVTITGIAGDGTLAIQVDAGSATDAAGNAAPGASGTAVVVDSTLSTAPGVPVAAPIGLGLLILTLAGVGMRRRMK